MKSSDALSALGALAHASRLDVFRLLVRRGPEGYTPGEIAQKLDLPDPAAAAGSEADKVEAFRIAFRQLERRITLLINLPIASLERLALHAELKSIGQS